MPTRHPDYANVVVFDHPLIRHKLTHMRDKVTSHRPFRALIAQIAGLMAYEVTRGFPVDDVEIQTPMGPDLGRCVGGRITAAITVVPILRAGLGMAEGIMELMPEARVGHLGMARNEQTLEPEWYLERLPADLAAGPVVVVDPMLATGGSASAAITRLQEVGATDLRLMCLVAAPPGIERVAGDHPGLTVYAAAVDDRLDERGFIVPGLGDAGDRMYGTV
ncbi:MAG: uracil phosphoribosyltransferase [Planctomycetota bacterium]